MLGLLTRLQTPAVSTDSIAVLPMRAQSQDAAAEPMAALLTNLLTTRLAEVASRKVISADEVADLLRHEADRQQVGCNDDGCLAEIAGALGARFLVVGGISQAGSEVLWEASLVDQQTAQVVEHSLVRVRKLGALPAQVEDVALRLSGRGADVGLEGAGDRLGFVDAGALAAFRSFRAAHADLAPSEALTEFIMERNRENGWLAAAEVGAFAATLPLILLTSASAAMSWGLAAFPFGLPQIFAVLTMVTGALLLAALTTGVVLVVLDAMNVGRVKIRRSGCCRDDAALLDAEKESTLQRLASGAVVSMGAAALAAGIAGFALPLVVGGLLYSVNLNSVGGIGYVSLVAVSGFYPFSIFSLIAASGSGLCAGVMTVAAGLALLFMPRAPMVLDDVEAAP